MKQLNKLTMLFLALTLSTSLMAQTPTPPASGDGTSGNPYQVATLDNLYWVTQNSGEWSKYYIQTADIDATSTNTWDGGAGFTPIGNFTINFTGSYNGQNHTIDGLYINRTTSYYQGLFGVADAATIKNIGLTNVDVSGDGWIGGLVGYNRTSTVSNCYSTGSVSGNERIGGLVGNNRTSTVSNCYSAGSVSGNNYIGGLLGYNYSSSSVNNCYSTGSVSGNDYIGGFAGQNSGWLTTVSNCYSTGSVSGTVSNVGGLVGSNTATVNNSFWDTQTSGQSTSAGGTGKTTAEMKTQSTFTDAGWDFVGETTNGTNNYWNINGSINDGYPYLSVGYPASGDGTSGNPYQVATLDNLYWVTQNSGEWSKYYIQTADIDATSTNTWDGGAGFTPIGNFTINFTGSYNGQNHTIDGLYINRTTSYYQGLFGVADAATIKNIGLTNVDVSGDGWIGGLVGYNRTSTVSNCYSTGSVSGNERIGGLVGNNRTSTVSNCYSAGSVSGNNYIGGLLGYNYSSSSVNNCYSTGSVSGNDYIGGFAGQNSGWLTTVSNCYSTGSVSGTVSNVGGLVGSNTATVNNSFWDTQTSGQSTSAGGTGKTTAEMKTQSTFTDAGWDFVGETTNGTNDYWGMLSGVNSGYAYLTMQKAEWTGTISSVWDLAGNWSVDAIPPAAFDITIPNVTNDPVIATTGTASCNNLTLESGASLTIQSDNTGTGSLITNGTITNNGTVNIQRYITESVWHLISVPNNVTTANTFNGDYLQTWDETTATWTDIVEPTTALTPVKGYGFWGTPAKAATYTFTGTPNTGNQSLAVTFTEVAGFDNDGANLLGNPYPSSIDWSGLDDTWGAVYYWNGTGYVTWNNGSGAGSQYVPPMQGFFIVATSSGTFQLANSDRSHNGAGIYYKSSNELTNGLVLEASNGSYNDELYIIFDEGASEGFDLQYDAYKFLSGTEGLSEFYSFTDDKMLSIDVRPACETIQLGFQNDENGIYNIGIKEMADISEAILEDTKTGTFHNLQTGSYEFVWDVNDNEKRFILHLNAVGIEEGTAQQNETLIYASGKTIYIKNTESRENVQVRISDITGRIVLEKDIQSTGLTSIPTNLKSGVYIVSLVKGKTIETEKVFIK